MTKREQICALLEVHPQMTQRAVARAIDVSPGYVHLVRQEMYRTEMITRPVSMKPDQSTGRYVWELADLTDEGARFGTILADPPWPYSNQRTRAATGNHYQAMSLDDLAALPVAALAAEASHLHLWTTVTFLQEGLQLLTHWGFTYKSYLIWHKPQIGLGNYWRIGTEMLLLGIRGECRFLSHDKPNHFSCRRGQHSRKPDVVRQWIGQVSPGPALELFGREVVPGWTVWGNQIDQTVFCDQSSPAIAL